jgi:hypothetical protein
VVSLTDGSFSGGVAGKDAGSRGAGPVYTFP